MFGGHDACIANLPGVRYACCGHSMGRVAYVVFDDGLSLYGNAALAAMEMIGGTPPEPHQSHLEWIVGRLPAEAAR